MPLRLVRQDITRMNVDVIVNAANTGLRMGGGACGAIFHAAGAHRMQAACDRLSPIRTGDAVATPGFDLPARYVIHTAGPVWQGGGHDEESLLRACYRNSLTLAARLGCGSIAFPVISAGIYGYPKAQALHVAVDEIRRYLTNGAESASSPTPTVDSACARTGADAGASDLDVVLCVFDQETFTAGTAFDRQLREYIDDHYAAEHGNRAGRRERELREARHRDDGTIGHDGPSLRQHEPDGSPYPLHAATPAPWEPRPAWEPEAAASPAVSAPTAASAESPRPAPGAYGAAAAASWGNGDDVLADLDEPFNIILMRLIDAKGLTDVDVYKRANISRKLFSKIRCGNGYMPGKKTVLALAVALRLDIDETADLLACAGYALSHSMKFDVIVEFFITHGNFDVFAINEALFRYDQPLLGQ